MCRRRNEGRVFETGLSGRFPCLSDRQDHAESATNQATTINLRVCSLWKPASISSRPLQPLHEPTKLAMVDILRLALLLSGILSVAGAQYHLQWCQARVAAPAGQPGAAAGQAAAAAPAGEGEGVCTCSSCFPLIHRWTAVENHTLMQTKSIKRHLRDNRCLPGVGVQLFEEPPADATHAVVSLRSLHAALSVLLNGGLRWPQQRLHAYLLTLGVGGCRPDTHGVFVQIEGALKRHRPCDVTLAFASPLCCQPI